MSEEGKDRRFLWTPAALLTLLDQWEENGVGVRKNSHIYKEIADVLNEFGPSHVEVKNKLENLTRKYRSELAKVGPSGGSPSTWEHFERVSLILQT
ncbi:trihelix transcription factor ASIL1-like [Drosophila obscura]|uniref:trihelix transcription factor ASIL1-like n=1 Tax=Drosophila obscura TaxID=7282 RepID=UPI001BB15E41|nr:trihelix transcription factor ASIL1-like [Drosophila obscura]